MYASIRTFCYVVCGLASSVAVYGGLLWGAVELFEQDRPVFGIILTCVLLATTMVVAWLVVLAFGGSASEGDGNAAE